MDNRQYELKVISDGAKEHIQDLEVVTPAIYDSVYASIARSNDIDIEGQDTVSSEMLKEQIEQYINMRMQTSEQVRHLSESANKAVDAIEKKDTHLLQSVLDEVQSLRQEIDRLKDTVFQDTLTKVFNRKWLDELCLQDEGDLFGVDGALVIIDLNDFKLINDTYGHIVGDKVLIFIASQLKQLGGDVIRYGGDEFIIIFPKEISLDQVDQRLHNRREIVLKRTLRSGDRSFKISFSYGSLSFVQGDSFESIVTEADIKMYEDKTKIKARLSGL